MTKEAETSPRTMQRICRDDLGMSPYNIQKRQLLSSAIIEKRLARSKMLLNCIKDGILQNIFTDEKLFMAEQCHNHQND